MRPQSARLTHEAAQVFAVAVNGLVFARLLDGDLKRIGGGDALDGGAGAPRVEGPVVVVAQLDDDPVAGTDALLHGGPEAAVEGARRGASECLILHGDPVFVEIFVGKAAPAPLAVVAVAERAGAHRAVAHKEEHGVVTLAGAAGYGACGGGLVEGVEGEVDHLVHVLHALKLLGSDREAGEEEDGDDECVLHIFNALEIKS